MPAVKFFTKPRVKTGADQVTRGPGSFLWLVMLDLSGVLRVPDASWIRVQLAALGLTRSELAVRRAHYRAISAFDQAVVADHKTAYRETYPAAFLDALSLPSQLRSAVRTVLFDGGFSIGRQTADAASVAVAHALAAAGAMVVVVTNAASPGASRAWLAGVGLVPRDHGGPVTAVIDSSEVGVAKPDPAILHLALGAVGWSDHDLQRVAFVGDSLRLDGEAARRAGVWFLHFDPFRECPEPAHGHLQRLAVLLELIR